MNVDDIYYVSNSFLPSSPSSYQLEYSTSNNKIAYVDSLGLLVVKGIGEVTITITDKKTNLEKSIDIVISNKILLDDGLSLLKEKIKTSKTLVYDTEFKNNVTKVIRAFQRAKQDVYSENEKFMNDIGKPINYEEGGEKRREKERIENESLTGRKEPQMNSRAHPPTSEVEKLRPKDVPLLLQTYPVLGRERTIM